MNDRTLDSQFDTMQRRALIIGAAGILLLLVGAVLNTRQFFQSYLFAYLFWVGLGLGCLAILMMHHVAGGRWGFVSRRLLESAAMTLPLMALLFVPILLGMSDLFVWARPDVVAGDAVLEAKQWYLNVPFFVIRLVIYFAIWTGGAYLLNRWSRLQDERSDDAVFRQRFQTLSGPGLVVYALTATFASFDWGMSLEPHWYSTIYGMMFVVGQALSAFAFATALVVLLADRKPFSEVVSADLYNDFGNLLFTFVVLWAYMAYSQYLIIWSGNLPEEIPWYLHRIRGGWQWVAVLLIVFHFALPFVILLSRRRKRSATVLKWVAAGIIVMRFVDLFWRVMPAFYEANLHVHWLDIVAPIGLGGIWVAVFLWQLKGKPLLPNDPRYLETE